ncbi:MAG TPA: glycerol dehydratase reactivase beta/small subunit family protein [Gaiellaceae bacterium]
MSSLVVALLADGPEAAGLAAGFEEEGVPLTIERAGEDGSPEALARIAAKRSPLGLGIGGDGERLALVLAAAPGRPYLEAPVADARRFGQAAARVAARRPLRPGPTK